MCNDNINVHLLGKYSIIDINKQFYVSSLLLLNILNDCSCIYISKEYRLTTKLTNKI